MDKSLKKQLSQIEASLQYGRFYTGKWIFLFCLPIILSALVYIGNGVLFFGEAYGNGFVTDSTKWYLIGTGVGFFLIDLLSFYMIYKNHKLKKKIVLWLDDAVERNADSIALSYEWGITIFSKVTKLQVSFRVDGHRKTFISGNPQREKKFWDMNNGYFQVLTKYADSKIKILYSQKYNQVLIIKREISET